MAFAVRSLAGVASSGIRFHGLNGSCGMPGRRSVAGGRRAWRIRAEEAEEGEAGPPAAIDEDAEFEARIARLQKKMTSGTGKKAEMRKARKEGDPSPFAADGGSPKAKDMFIPPVALKEPVSDGLVVELGFTSYTERLNGRLAALGLAAVLLVELATGDSFLKFHDSGSLSLQVYTVLGLVAVFIKYEKEKISVWPKD